MSILDRLRNTASSATDAAKRQAKRAQLEIQASRLESSMRREKTKIGEALYPSLESGAIESDLAEVQAALAEIAALDQRLAANTAALEALKADDDDEGEAEPTPLLPPDDRSSGDGS